MLVPVLLGLDLHQSRHVGSRMRVWEAGICDEFREKGDTPRNKQLRLVDYLSAYQIPEVGCRENSTEYSEKRKNRGVQVAEG